VVLVDTNVLVDVLEDDPRWADWSTSQLRAQSLVHELAINPIVYSEISLAFASVEDVDQAVDGMGLRLLEIPRAALFLGRKAFLRYRREGGVKTGVLPDFLIGAHAAVSGCALLTRDVRRYRMYFPRVMLIAP
jgi:hypothetical protein